MEAGAGLAGPMADVSPAIALCPRSAHVAVAEEWRSTDRVSAGFEGVVVEANSGRYKPGGTRVVEAMRHRDGRPYRRRHHPYRESVAVGAYWSGRDGQRCEAHCDQVACCVGTGGI